MWPKGAFLTVKSVYTNASRKVYANVRYLQTFFVVVTLTANVFEKENKFARSEKRFSHE